MIIDGHVYCFTSPDSAGGHADAATHMQFWQRAYALHHQPAYRLRDRAPGDSRLLLAPQPAEPLRLATNRNFRIDRASRRFVWTVDGDDYTKQFLPPNILEYGAGAIIAEMDYAGVDLALIHMDATLGKDPAYVAECVRAFPDRLRSMAPVDEWLIPTHPDAAIQQAVAGIKAHGLHALKIIPAYAYGAGASQDFNDAAWRPFWEAAVQLGVPIFFTLGPSPGSANPRDGLIQELNRLRRWLDRYPGVTTAITHGFNWRDFLEGKRINLPEEIWTPFADSRLSMEVCFPVRIGDVFDYPYRECWPILETMVKRVGSSRLFWGTDMPFQNRFCTYRQSRHYIERYCQDFLSPQDMENIMGRTSARILNLRLSNLAP